MKPNPQDHPLGVLFIAALLLLCQHQSQRSLFIPASGHRLVSAHWHRTSCLQGTGNMTPGPVQCRLPFQPSHDWLPWPSAAADLDTIFGPTRTTPFRINPRSGACIVGDRFLGCSWMDCLEPALILEHPSIFAGHKGSLPALSTAFLSAAFTNQHCHMAPQRRLATSKWFGH